VTQENLPFKERYTIQDLENLSGIQAHTLRIWEKRYDLLHPVRAGNNVRYYCHKELQKLLNIAALYHHDYKISKIAALSETELLDTVRQETLADLRGDYAGHSLKLAMLNYDQALFDQTVQNLLSQKSFRDCFRTVFLPFLNEIGLLWQTGVITIAHEHFLSNLLRQKILYQVDQLHTTQIRPDAKVFVLFLPLNEVHELGLLYSHYELLLHGHRSIYLGQSVPVEALADLQAGFPAITFITSCTIHPQDEKISAFLKDFSSNLLRKGKDELWVSGRKIQDPKTRTKLHGVRYILSPDEFLKAI
jgi:MerR family transcriptional regulator, light-induced transcriptional regulator